MAVDKGYWKTRENGNFISYMAGIETKIKDKNSFRFIRHCANSYILKS